MGVVRLLPTHATGRASECGVLTLREAMGAFKLAESRGLDQSLLMQSTVRQARNYRGKLLGDENRPGVGSRRGG